MRGQSPQDSRKRRTPEHVIEERSVNFLERQVLARKHQLQRPTQREYGWDATMFHFSDEGFIENGEVRFQLKATNHLHVLKNRTSISIEIDIRDLNLWAMEVYPFILVIYDAKAERAYWLHIQDYVGRSEIFVDSRDKITLQIPLRQKVGMRAIDHFRRLSQANIDAFWERNPADENSR